MSLRLTGAIANGTKMFTRACSGSRGDGIGKGGGSGGSIRDAGGAFGKMEAAREDEYFYKLQHEQLHRMSEELQKEIDHHKDVVERHQKRLDEIEKMKKDTKKQ